MGNGNQSTALAVTENANSTAIEARVESALSQVQTEEKLFELAQRKAQIYSKSSLVPKEYQNNVGNVLIAENMARRMGADTLMVMQNLYVVHNRPGWSSQFLIATFNSSGKFTAIKYRFKGEPKTPEWGCQAYCTEISTGEEISGAWVTWEMANKEGWVNKNGSKWQTMPEQMFRYRSATFMVRVTAPEIGMGLLTKEELEDIASANGDTITRQGVDGLKERLHLDQSLDAPTTDDRDGVAAGFENVAASEPQTIDVTIIEEAQESVEASSKAEADTAADSVELTSKHRVDQLVYELQKNHGVKDAELKILLPAGVKKYSDLDERQAIEVLPSLEMLLENKQAV